MVCAVFLYIFLTKEIYHMGVRDFTRFMFVKNIGGIADLATPPGFNAHFLSQMFFTCMHFLTIILNIYDAYHR